MVKSVEGVYRDGKVELLEPAPAVDEARVIVTFLASGHVVDLSQHGISPEQAANLRGRLKAMHQDWERPDMDAYDAL